MQLPELKTLNLTAGFDAFEKQNEIQRQKAARNALAQFGPAAMQGDPEAINALMKVNPAVGFQIIQSQQQAEQANKLAKMKFGFQNRPKAPPGMMFIDPANPAAGVKRIPGAFESMVELANAKRPLVNVSNSMPPDEKEESKKVGAFHAETFANTQTAADAARQTLNNVARFESLMEQTPTDSVQEALLPLKRAMVGLGFATEDQVRDVGNMEGMLSLATQFSLDFVGQTKGAVSDAEMALFMRAAPNIGNTPQGNALILDKAEAVAKRQIEIANLQRKYRNGQAIVIGGKTFKAERKGTVAGFRDVQDAYHAANPLFSDAERAQLEGALVVDDPAAADPQTEFVAGETTATDAEGNVVVWDGQDWVPMQ